MAIPKRIAAELAKQAEQERELAHFRAQSNAAAKLRTAQNHAAQLLKENQLLAQRIAFYEETANRTPRPPLNWKASRRPNDAATVLLCCNDWHTEQRIEADHVNGINHYDLTVAQRRITNLWNGFLFMLDATVSRLCKPERILLWLGGDLINGYIHDENLESNTLGPTEAIQFVQDNVATGIDLIRKTTKLPIDIETSMGNHGRTTHKPRIATGYKTSWEYLAYCNLARWYRKETWARFNVGKGDLSYYDVYNRKIRFLHGDKLKFNGGSGGVMVPFNLKVAKWDGKIKADHTIVGHFHHSAGNKQNRVVNALVGYDSYALSIGATYQEPSQEMFVFTQKYGMTGHHEIFVERN